ncbi:MAG: UDP-N-acetylmuramoyl-L-alanine--D-glutamate ligase [Candidatus Tectomicrobia bacterium]|nr:UDP-N-acetylmuramoyl-L-alanine--D-glutamate ligase [Candidatus Tectomicrobia bacterium]
MAAPALEPEVQGRRFTVMGLARTGEAAARFLAGRGALVTVTDRRPEAELADILSRLPREVRREVGGHPPSLFEEADAVVVSPGVPREHPLLARAAAAGVPVWSEIELAFRFCKVPVIGVTGTNGKTTTTSLISALLQAGGLRAPAVGNIGSPFIAALSAPESPDFLVVEVSSFQLEWVETFRPFVAVVTNITPDHLDRHQDLEEYVGWKRRIFAAQEGGDFLVLNADDDWVSAFAGEAKPQIRRFSRREAVAEGACLDGGRLVLRSGGTSAPVLAQGEFPLHGVHNLENALAAVAAAAVCGASAEAMGRALRAFRPIEHRLTLVRERRGVRWYNDSKGTNVGATVRSLESFDAPILLIAGGRDKHSDLTPLRPLIRDRVKTLILIGEARARFRSAFAGLTECIEAETMAEAVRKADEAARPGDIVLLSPACASFDMFIDYEDRGRKFTAEVESLSP